MANSPLEIAVLGATMQPLKMEGEITFTKTPKGYGYGEVTFNHLLFEKALNLLNQTISKQDLISRFQSANLQNIKLDLPRHYPVLISNTRGVFGNKQNLFVYFPYCMKAAFSQDYDSNFSLEFYERSEQIFNSILAPALTALFSDSERLVQDIQSELPINVWTFSMLHELGHHIGHWYMSPKTNPKIKVNGFLKGIFGELSSDLFSLVLVPEKREANLLNILMKCFYYPRIGYSQNPLAGRLNTDNDTWEGILLLHRLLVTGGIVLKESKLKIVTEVFMSECRNLLNEIDKLGFEIGHYNEKKAQEKILDDWMIQQLPFENGRWILPREIRVIYDAVSHLPELTS
jgi:hypothetical protein